MYFGIGSGKGVFSIREFIAHLEGQVPLEYSLNNKNRETV